MAALLRFDCHQSFGRARSFKILLLVLPKLKCNLSGGGDDGDKIQQKRNTKALKGKEYKKRPLTR
jgi:hypothetical protein